jgi:hypothetical protein
VIGAVSHGGQSKAKTIRMREDLLGLAPYQVKRAPRTEEQQNDSADPKPLIGNSLVEE